MTVLDFFRSEPVRLGIKAGFLGAAIYLALRSAGLHDIVSPMDCAGVVVLAGRIRVGLSLADSHPAAGLARVLDIPYTPSSIF